MFKKKYFILLITLAISTIAVQAKTKIACIGASITYGAGIAQRETNAYPAQLQKLMGGNYEVRNFGISGTTLLSKGDYPYQKTAKFNETLQWNPDIVIIDLGGNDAKAINRKYISDFKTDYMNLIGSFKQLRNQPRIVLLTAMVSFVKDSAGIWDPVITKKINPLIQEIAFAAKVEVIDMHAPLINHQELFPDLLHPNAEGASIMANTVYSCLSIKRDPSFDIFSRLSNPLKIAGFFGYECADFNFEGRNCKVVKPKSAAKGHPWVWRARFWAHEPQADIALLEKGFHIVYCDVAELLGNQTAINIWNAYYNLLVNAGLNKKAVMEGMSRGGIYVFNWAAENPGKVACVYVDNPLLNISGWASAILESGKPNDMVRAFMTGFGLKDLAEIKNFNKNPTDRVAEIVKGKYPILILCADADEQVKPSENTLDFERKILAKGGQITVIHKPGSAHHPHSLPNPKPIVDFILNATANF